MRFFRQVPRVAPLGPAGVEVLAGVYAQQWQSQAPPSGVAAQLTPTAADLEAWLRGGFEVYSASFDGRLIGGVRLAFATGACVVDMLTVVPSERRRGVGAYLVDYAAARARRAGALRVWAAVPAGLDAALSLLEAHSFRRYAEYRSPATGAAVGLYELVL